METSRKNSRYGCGRKFDDNLGFQGLSPQLEDIAGSTVVYINSNFTVQDSEPNAGYGIFYIQKYQKILTNPQFQEFLASHPDEKFVLMDDGHGTCTDFWAYTVSKPNQLTIHIFNKMDEDCVMKEVAILRNKFGLVEWDEPEILDPRIQISTSVSDEGSENEKVTHSITLEGFSKKSYDYTYGGYSCGERYVSWINHEDGQYSTAELLRSALELPNQTRVVSVYHGGNNYEHIITANKYSTLPLITRYGIREEDISCRWYVRDYFHTSEDDVFPDVPLDDATMKRVTDYMTTVLKNLQASSPDADFCHTTLVVLDKPVPGHRRPTYHYFYGAINGDAIDVVDICRGELQIEGMVPVNCYHLRAKDGRYYKISHIFFGSVKSDIQNADIDVTSFEEWNDTRAVHPELVATLATCGDKTIDLHLIRLLNTLPFGITFIEQLIKTGHVNLGHALARKIRTEADNPNYRCSSLTDILPGASPDGTTILEVLNMTKPCYNYLIDNITKNGTENLNLFITKYRAVKQFLSDGIFTTTGSKGVEDYLNLYEHNDHQCNSLTGETIDLLKYPDEMRTIAKMYQKIDKKFATDSYQRGEARRRYWEISTAYIKIKELGQNPGAQLVFIDFGLGMENPEALDMLDRRQKAASNAIENCKAKLEEPRRRAVEKTYDSRKKFIKKLESDDKLQKDPDFAGYVVIAPSGIYGKEDTRTIEHEGKYMDHCVYNAYSRDIANGEYTVLYLRKKSSPENGLVTIGIDEHGRINQTYTFHDHGIDRSDAMAIAAWAKSKAGLVTFQSDSGTVSPGGWNAGVPVPHLPKPGKEWLEKLGKVVVAPIEKIEL